MSRKFFKKIVVCLIVSSFFLPTVSIFALGPLDVPITDDLLRTKEVGFTIFGVTAVGVTLDLILIELVRGIIERLADDTIDWINNRDTDDGGPAFAVDLEGFLKTTADRIAGNIIDGAGLGALCSPFQDQIRGALRLSFGSGGRSTDDIEPSCTLSQVTNNIEGFFNGDFSGGGGWNSWFVVSQDPYGNPFSATLSAQGVIARKAAEAVGIEEENLSWSKGFFNSKDCTDPVGAGPADCKEYGPTKTPGGLIEGQLQKVFGSEIDQLNIADEFDEVLAAIAGMLMESVFSRAGVFNNSGLSGRAQKGGSQRQIFGACSPNKNSALIADGETIIWTYTGAQGVSLVWGGDEIPTGSTGRTVNVIYTSVGNKSAYVTVTRLDSTGNPVGNSQTITCTGFVNVTQFGPLAMTCVGPSQATARFGDSATWTVNITGGSGRLGSIILDQITTLGPVVDNGDTGGPFWSDYGLNQSVRYARIVGFSPPALSSALPANHSGFNFRPVGNPLPLIPANGITTIGFTIEYRVGTEIGNPMISDLSLGFNLISDMDSSVIPLTNVKCGNSIYFVP